MTTSSPSSSAGGAAITRLNGWKEIAAYFGRGVRTVQRWEKTFGMPVHRIGSGRGENVHAFTAELDAWLAAVTRSRAALDQPGDADLSGSPQPAPSTAEAVGDNPTSAHDSGGPLPASRTAALASGRVAWAAVGAFALLLLAAIVAWLYRPVAVPSSAKPDGDTLRVYDADHRLLWSHTFSAALPTEPPVRFGNGLLILIDDVNGDGRREVLTFAPDSDTQWPTTLFCFDAGGRLLWTRVVRKTVRFGSVDYAPSWTGLYLFTTGTGPGKRLWSTWVHTESGMFPCLLENLSGATGLPASEFWSAGYVNMVKEFPFAGRRGVFVGAANNDHKGAGLVVLDASRPTGVTAAETDDKTCRNCPAGPPLAQLVFPRLEVAELWQAIPTVFDVRRSDSGEFSAWVLQPAADGVTYGAVSYRLDRNLKPLSSEVSASYRSAHKAAEDAGRIKHPFGPEDHTQAWPVLVFDGARFLPVTGAVVP